VATKTNLGRSLVTREAPLTFHLNNGSTGYSSNSDFVSLTEAMLSRGNPISRLGNGVEDIGGPWFHTKQSIVSAPMVISIRVPDSDFINHGNTVVGSMHIGNGTKMQNMLSDTPTIAEPSDSAMNADATTAIARCKPDNPAFSVAQEIGELREGIPRGIGLETWKSRTLTAKQAGSEYLNVEFGWKPLVSDIQKAMYAVTHSHEILTQYHHDSGKLIHRRYDYPSTTTTSTGTFGGGTGPNGPATLGSPYTTGATATIQKSMSSTTKKWFSGCFIYHVDMGSSNLDRLHRHYQDAQKLLGIGLTPDVVWELTPWSWLADWFTNTGDIMSNIRSFAFDGLVMTYGYIMQETKATNTYTLDIPGWGVDGSSYHGSAVVSRVSQKRLPGNPFGFGLTKANLSPRQLAILAAVGIILIA
jgi:hypothetical protein